MAERGQYGNELVIGRSRGGGHRGGGGHHGGGHHGGGHHGGGWGGYYQAYPYWGYSAPYYYAQPYAPYYYAQPYVQPYGYEIPDYIVDVRRVHALMGEPGVRDHRASAQGARDHRTPAHGVRDHRSLPPPSARDRGFLSPTRPDDRVAIPPQRALPAPPVAQPAPPARHHPAHHPAHHARHWEPPTAHHHHQDYVYVDGYEWWPSWFPYWEPYWYWYWKYLYLYYGGDADPQYAEYARDVALRTYVAPQRGWR